MLLELYEFPFEARSLHLLLGLALGLIFGIAAQITRFCLRRSLVGDGRAQAGAVWLTALATAIAAFALATAAGYIDVSGHRLITSDIPVLAIAVGGLAFGAGMVLTRGCVSRLTVLGASCNLRAVTVLVAFAIVAHATLKGILAPLRVELGAVTVDLGIGTLGFAPLFALGVFAIVATLAYRARPKARDLALGAVIGVIPVIGWAATSVLLMDEFDPLPVQSAAFTLPWTDGLFWVIASSAVPAGFGVGWIGGVMAGAFGSAALRGELDWQSFETPAQTGRYMAGGALMGVGGVLAGGCTVGAGLSGGAMLSVSALLALAFIAIGALVMNRVLQGSSPIAVPAE